MQVLQAGKRRWSGIRRSPGGGLVVSVLLGVINGGCGGGPDFPHAAIRGTVAVDGRPIESGSIAYFSESTSGQRTGRAEIAQGHYEIAGVPIGRVTFTFSASRETGKMVPGPGGALEAERVNLIPKKYSSEGIERVIEGDGTQDFDIASSPDGVKQAAAAR